MSNSNNFVWKNEYNPPINSVNMAPTQKFQSPVSSPPPPSPQTAKAEIIYDLDSKKELFGRDDEKEKEKIKQRNEWIQKSKNTPQLCCCDLQSGVMTMASIDMFISTSVGLVYAFQESQNIANSYQYILGMIISTLFTALSIMLLCSGCTRSRVLGWTFIILNALLLIGSIAAYFTLYWATIEEKYWKWAIVFLITFAFIYKTYQSVCVYYFIYELPPPLPYYEEIHLMTQPPRVVPIYVANGYNYYDPIIYSAGIANGLMYDPYFHHHHCYL